jgi:Fe-S oxidoreductase
LGIEEIRETTESCKHCYMCRHACPTFLATKLDSHTPRGYALLLSEIDYGFQSFTPTIVERFYQCSLCGLCREDCAYHWAEDEVVRNAREEIVQRSKAPRRVEAIAQRIKASGTPHQDPAPPFEVSSGKKQQRGAEVLYFAGCSARHHHPQIIAAVDKLLGSLKTSWTFLEEEGCCGTPLW